MTAHEKLAVRRLLTVIEDCLGNMSNQFIFENNDKVTRAQIKKVYTGYLDHLKSKEAVSDFSVADPQSVYHGWKELYPSLKDRVKAYIALKILRKPSAVMAEGLSMEEELNHTWWGYRLVMHEITQEDIDDLGLSCAPKNG